MGEELGVGEEFLGGHAKRIECRGERLVGRRQDGERSRAAERLDESSSLNCGYQRRVIFGIDSVIDNGLGWIHRCATYHLGLLCGYFS